MDQSRRPDTLARLIVPIVLALLPLLLMGGGMAAGAQAQITPTPAAQTQEVKVLRVYFRDIAERDSLATEFAAEEVPTSGGYLTIIADPATEGAIVGRGLRVEVDERATQELNSATLGGQTGQASSPDTFYGGYRTVPEIYAFLDGKVAAYPTLAEKVDIGDSWCKLYGPCNNISSGFSGFDLNVMRITNRSIPGPKPVFWFDAGIHSREIATPEVAMRYISYLLDNYNTDADARWLVDYHDIWVMPIFNPDGHHIVSLPGSSVYPHRKNANNTNDLSNVCSFPSNNNSQIGIDLNRNFPFKWACCGGSSAAPCSLIYRGPSSESEVETHAVTAKIRTLIPDQRASLETSAAPITTTGIYQNLHSFGALNLYPWGYTSDPAPNSADLRNIAAHISAPDAGGNGYRYGQPPAVLYKVDGDAVSWAYGELGIPSVTTELTGTTTADFYPPYSKVESQWNQNRGMLLHMAKIARTPYLTTRGPDANLTTSGVVTVGKGAQAPVNATINYSWTGNAYAQNVGAAEYYIDTPPWAGGTPLPMSPGDGSFDAPVETAAASVDTAALPLGRHIIYVRGRGVTSYEGYASWGPVSAFFLDVVDPSAVPTPTVPSCPVQFSDVRSTDTFYPFVRCLACRNILGGYDDNTFRPNNNITRGQIAKIVANAAGFGENPGGQRFQDVPPGSTFYDFINRLAGRNVMAGYACSMSPGTTEQCVGPDNLPYFRPNTPATRGQMAKIVANAANLTDPLGSQVFEDVQPGDTFYEYVQRLANRGVMGGYVCGGPNEPCAEPTNRPYFRPGNNVTRGQASKIVANTFFPGCENATP